MRKNMNTRITGTNVMLVPYQKEHVAKYVPHYLSKLLSHVIDICDGQYNTNNITQVS